MALAAAFIISAIATPAGISGAVLLLPFQVSVLGTPSPAVTPTNLLYNVVSTPGALYRYRRQHQTGWRLALVLIIGTLWPDRRRCLAGGLLASGCAAALAIPAPDMAIATWLGLLANNTAIMTAIPPGQAAAAGGMVNMARGLGTALGVAVVILALHAAARLGHPSAGPAAAMAALAMCALASAWAGRRVGTGHSDRAARAAGPDSGAVSR